MFKHCVHVKIHLVYTVWTTLSWHLNKGFLSHFKLGNINLYRLTNNNKINVFFIQIQIGTTLKACYSMQTFITLVYDSIKQAKSHIFLLVQYTMGMDYLDNFGTL